MKKEDFQIGVEFYTGTGKWRVTDIGTCTIIAIKLGELEESYYTGPPYLVLEHVFDEYDFGGCDLEDRFTEEPRIVAEICKDRTLRETIRKQRLEYNKAYKNPKWLIETSRRLNILKTASKKYQDPGEVLPPDDLYEEVKTALQNLIFSSNLSYPDVWLGPDGEIGITWENNHAELELIFSADSSGSGSLLARKTYENGITELLREQNISAEASKFE